MISHGEVLFRYAEAVTARFPAVRGGLLHARGVANDPSPDGLRAAFRCEQEAALERLAAQAIADLPSIEAWRRAFSAFGVKPTQYRSAAEALLRRLQKQGEIPSIALLVDIGNLVSIRHALPVAVLDLRAVTGPTTVRFATGEERFTDLGTGGPAPPEPGEVVFVDDAGLASARRWCWRQSLESSAGASTTEILVTIEGQHETAEGDVAAALDDLEALLAELLPGSARKRALLSPAHPFF